MKFTERFNEILKSSRINQVEIANKLGLNKTAVTKYKNGEILPSLEKFYELCQILDVSADYLLGLSDNY